MNTPFSDLPQAGSVWWQHPGWYRALTLSERLAGRPTAAPHRAGSDPARRDQVEGRLQQWKAQPPFQSGSFFAERLALDGLTEQDLLALLEEPLEDMQARLPLPEWLQTLRQILAARDASTSLSGFLPALDEKVQIAAFLPALQPLLAQGHQDLLLGVDELEQRYTWLPVARQPVIASLLAGLARQLLFQTSRTYALELKVAGMLGRLRGTTPQERFARFVQQLSQPEALLLLLEEYAVLARALVQTVEHWRSFSLEFLDHLCADWAEICERLLSGNSGYLLEGVQSEAGDQHRGGRSVLLLTLCGGTRLVYKPKSLAIDQHFQELLTWLNVRGAEPSFQTLKVLDKGRYGWTEFVAARDCETTAEVQRFYERQGAYLALLYGLEATDMHAENLIAASEHPLLIDLETLFHPRLETSHAPFAGEPASEALAHSVMRVLLLPFRLWGNKEAPGVKISGLGGEDGQLTPRPVPQWADGGTDQMRLVRTRIELRAKKNRPQLNGQPIELLAYAGSLLAGFKRMYGLLMAQRADPLNNWRRSAAWVLLVGWVDCSTCFVTWGDPALFQRAEELVSALPDLIERDEHLDMMAGSAGCIACLLSLYAVAPSPGILQTALRCGDQLRACAQPMPAGTGWKVLRDGTPLAGFAHGAAGIALSLLRLAAVSGEERFHQAALAAIAYEPSLFVPENQNWLDLRQRRAGSEYDQTNTGEKRFMIGWCHGAAGIGLARLASLPYLDEAILRGEIQAALKTTLARGFGGDYTLCHGAAGNLETLLVASHTLGAAPYRAALEQGTGVLLEKASALSKRTEKLTGIEPPGFMLGLSGIGYTLLRIVEPVAVPSALLFAPPVPA